MVALQGAYGRHNTTEFAAEDKNSKKKAEFGFINAVETLAVVETWLS
jgi:hypothetical protein